MIVVVGDQTTMPQSPVICVDASQLAVTLPANNAKSRSTTRNSSAAAGWSASSHTKPQPSDLAVLWWPTSTTSGPQPNAAISRKALWCCSIPSAMMAMQSPVNSNPPDDGHRGIRDQSPPLRGTRPVTRLPSASAQSHLGASITRRTDATRRLPRPRSNSD